MILRRALFLNNIRRLTCQWRRMSFHAHYRYTHRPSLYRLKICLFLYDTNYTLFIVTTNRKCVDCILLRTDIHMRMAEYIRDDSNDEQKWKEKEIAV